jgi:hypothetical protein
MRRNKKEVEGHNWHNIYTAHHYLFFYLENKKFDVDGSLDDDFDNPVIT